MTGVADKHGTRVMTGLVPAKFDDVTFTYTATDNIEEVFYYYNTVMVGHLLYTYNGADLLVSIEALAI